MVLDGQRIEPAVRTLIAELAEHGFEAYIVGGAVRDLLLGIPPKDYDIATDARPEQVKRVFGRRARIIGRRFRLVHVTLGHHVFEVCTFRREPTPEERSTRASDDGVVIWSDNEFGSRDQDAVRRDFTVNAIYHDPRGSGRTVDLVGGVEDLRRGVVRMIGDPEERLAEDPVRMLRALKLAAQYGFTLEPTLASALRRLAPRIAIASKARCFEELLKVLAKPWSYPTFAICREFGLLHPFWPNLEQLWSGHDGHFLQRLLQARDEQARHARFGKSKTLALTTLALPWVRHALRVRGDHAPLWSDRPGLDADCRDALRAFFEPFAVPRFLQARARDVLLMLPRLLAEEPEERVVHHPQYRYARELVGLAAAIQGWPTEPLAAWPEPVHEGHVPRGGPGALEGGYGRRRRGGRGRGRGRGGARGGSDRRGPGPGTQATEGQEEA